MADSVIVVLMVNSRRTCGAASRGFVQRGGWPARLPRGESVIERGLPIVPTHACLRDWVSLVAQGSAAQGCVGGVEMFEGCDERASQRRCLELGHEVTSDAGAGLAARLRC